MRLALSIISVVDLVMTIGTILYMLVPIFKGNTIYRIIIQLVLFKILQFVQIPLLILQVLLDCEYVQTIFFLVTWDIMFVLYACAMGKELIENNRNKQANDKEKQSKKGKTK